MRMNGWMACGLVWLGCGAAATGPVNLDAGAYSQSCSIDADCVVVKLDQVCSACACADDAIAVSAKAQYDADVARISCPPDPSAPVCGACQQYLPTCAAGLCTAVAP